MVTLVLEAIGTCPGAAHTLVTQPVIVTLAVLVIVELTAPIETVMEAELVMVAKTDGVLVIVEFSAPPESPMTLTVPIELFPAARAGNVASAACTDPLTFHGTTPGSTVPIAFVPACNCTGT